MSAFESVLKLVKEWQPEALPSELKYRDSLIAHLRERLRNAIKIESEYRHLGTTTDIYVKQSGFWGSSEVFVELKCNLLSKGLLDRLVGQIESLQPRKNAIIVILCGETSPALVARLREKYGPPEGLVVVEVQFQIVVKEPTSRPIAIRSSSAKHPVRKPDKKVSDLIDLHRRRIKETRIANNYYAELRRLRETFLQHDLADKSAANRQFFDKWLADPVVEMGWTPGGGWTPERISALHADIENVRA
jgi:hypothetical protein